MYYIFSVLCFGLLLWFGLYIIQRDIKNPLFVLIGLSLITSSVRLAVEIINFNTTENLYLMRFQDLCWYFSIILLSGGILHYQTDGDSKRIMFIKVWRFVLVPLFTISGTVFLLLGNEKWVDVYARILLLVCILCFLITVSLLLPVIRKKTVTLIKKLSFLVFLFLYIGCLIISVISFGLYAIALSLIQSLSLFSIGVFLYASIVREQGEVWLPDFIRSFDYTILLTFLFSGQVALVIAIASDFHLTTILLLLNSIAISIIVQVFFGQIQAGFDYIAFSAFPKLRVERSRLRTTEEITLAINEEAEPEQMDEEQLVKMTRRALSHFGDLKRLSSNPLTQLKIIDHRLQEKGMSTDMLDRANELKSILLECIEQIKPQQDKSFGATDEWRFYNAVYFPYVVGIKPYSKRYFNSQLSEEEQKALEWFRTCVPERTFYNWSQTAAQLVATHLKSKL
ncbi:hypothetical protein [Shimazuella kribbensis]|uniref:hypothetical protein n=1 Tax=Shimazuella kribbensis TaxID=139808 RepID=UPI000418068C|nr:hypothetical protein [Shimazuella kribbensis]